MEQMTPEMPKFFIRGGWKELAQITGYHPQSLRRFHFYKAPLPRIEFRKDRLGRWVTRLDWLWLWFRSMNLKFKSDHEFVLWMKHAEEREKAAQVH